MKRHGPAGAADQGSDHRRQLYGFSLLRPTTGEGNTYRDNITHGIDQMTMCARIDHRRTTIPFTDQVEEALHHCPASQHSFIFYQLQKA